MMSTATSTLVRTGDTRRVESRRVESPRVESPSVDSPRIESPRVESRSVEVRSAGVRGADTDPLVARVAGGRVRLTGRGRALLVLALAALILAAFALGRSASSNAAGGEESAAAPTVTTVQPGDTLWGLAQRIAPDSDPREVVAQIRRLNDMGTSGLHAGQQLLLPA